MPEFHSTEDEAALYVLGELTDAERADFETRLAQSAELRALVAELQEGSVALAMSSPRRRPAPELWERIESAVANETRRKLLTPAFWHGWWRNGWAAAAACMLGWILYAWWINHARSTHDTASSAASKEDSAQGSVAVESARNDATTAARQRPALSANSMEQLLESRLRQIGALRSQVVDLQNQATQLSQALTQHQAMLAESSRLKFLQLTPPSNATGTSTTARVSPELQRALFLAMARELGWLSPAEIEADSNRTGVAFLDLRTNRVVNTPDLQKGDLQAVETSATSASSVASGGAIPVFTKGDSVFVGIDSSVATNGSTVTFLTGVPGEPQQTLGSTVVTNNPSVVIVPANANVTIVAGTAAGGSIVIGQLSAAGTTHP